MRGLDPTFKAARLANYVVSLRKEILQLSRACGVPHPALVTMDHVEILDDKLRAQPAATLFDYEPGWGCPAAEQQEAIRAIMEGRAPAAGQGATPSAR
jgi:hypothetical protein